MSKLLKFIVAIALTLIVVFNCSYGCILNDR